MIPGTVTIVTVNYAPEETGIAAYTTSLAEGLAELGVRVNVITAAPHYPAWRVAPKDTWDPDEIRNGVAVQRHRAYVPRNPGKVKRLLFEVLHGLRFVASPHARTMVAESDLVILVSPALLTSAVVQWALLRRPSAARTAMWVQDRYGAGLREIHGSEGSLPARLIASVEKWLANACDSVVVIHERWADESVADWGVEPDRVRVIRNWSHLPESPPFEVAEVRRTLGWGAEGEETVVLHAGNMGAKQDLGNVIRAARLAEAERQPIRFVLLGDGNQRALLEESAAGCSRLQFLHHLPGELYSQALASADILLVNEIEGMKSSAVPSKLTSYFTAGRPVVAATDPGSVTAEEVRSSGVGHVIPPADPEALLMACLGDPGSGLADPAKSGRSYVEKLLTRSAALTGFLSLHQSPRAASEHHSDDSQGQSLKKDPA